MLRCIEFLLWCFFPPLDCSHHFFEYPSLLISFSASSCTLILPVMLCTLPLIFTSFSSFSAALCCGSRWWVVVYLYLQPANKRFLFFPSVKMISDLVSNGILRYFHCSVLSKVLFLWERFPFLNFEIWPFCRQFLWSCPSNNWSITVCYFKIWN